MPHPSPILHDLRQLIQSEALPGLMLSPAQVQAVQALIDGSSAYAYVLDVGPGFQFETIADAVTYLGTVSLSETTPALVKLSPGRHVVSGTISFPAHVSVEGAGRYATMIDCGTGNYNRINFSGGSAFALRKLSIRGTRSAAGGGSSNGLLMIGATSRGVVMEEVGLYLKGGYKAALYCNWYSNFVLTDVVIFTDSVGIQATGRMYAANLVVMLCKGEDVATPLYGVTTIPGTSATFRLYMTGGFCGEGYFDDQNAESWFTSTAEPDNAQPLIGFYIPADHTPLTGTGTRFQLRDVECYVRNTNAGLTTEKIHCVLVEGAGQVRIDGGLYQVETPNSASYVRTAVKNAGTWNSGTTYADIELIGAPRITTAEAPVSGDVNGIHYHTASVTLLPYHTGTHFVDATAGPVTVTLPAKFAGGPRAGCNFKVIKTDASANAVTVAAAGAGVTIEGASTLVLSAQYDKCWLQNGNSQGNVWYNLVG